MKSLQPGRLIKTLASVTLVGTLGACTTLDFMARSAIAAPSDGGAGPAASRGGMLTLRGERILTLKTPNGKLQPDERAEIAAKRLNEAIAAGTATASAQQQESGRWAVLAGDTVLVIVTDSEADAQGLPAERVARIWAKRINGMLTQASVKQPPIKPAPIKQPSITLERGPIIVPIGKTRSIAIGGDAPMKSLSVEDDQSAVSNSELDAEARKIVVHGISLGTSRVTVKSDDNSAQASVPVIVEQYAAQVAPTGEATVTGNPTSPQIVTQAVYQSVVRALSLEPNAQVTIGSGAQVKSPLPAGESLTQHVSVTATGPDMISVDTTVDVMVSNRSPSSEDAAAPVTAGASSAEPIVPQTNASTLLYSNNPERVPAAQELFRGKLKPNAAVRLDYHHQNISGGTLSFHTELWNSHDEAAAVLVTWGISNPAVDTFQVGRRAGAAFLRALSSSSGIVVTVPAHSRVPLVAQRMPDGLSVSGVVQMQQLAGPKSGLEVHVAADNDAAVLSLPTTQAVLNIIGRDALLSPILDLPEASDIRLASAKLSSDVYEEPRILLKGAYAVGGKWEHLRLGHADALKDPSGKLTLFGNYGATYEIELVLSNPMDKAKTVVVVFDPSAGYAAGVFRLPDGSIIDFDPIQSPTDRELTRVLLAPGELQTLKLTTLPLNGSFYPVTLVVHSL